MIRIRNLGVGAVLASIFTLTIAPVQAAPLKKGQKFPAFTLKSIEGKTISPSTLKNKAYWITFFSSG